MKSYIYIFKLLSYFSSLPSCVTPYLTRSIPTSNQHELSNESFRMHANAYAIFSQRSNACAMCSSRCFWTRARLNYNSRVNARVVVANMHPHPPKKKLLSAYCWMLVDHGLTRMSIVVGASACGKVLRSGLFAPTAMSNALCIFTSATVATILVHASMRFTFTTTHYIYIYRCKYIYIYIRTLKQPEHICL